MITVKLWGGMCNQMFQYAFGYALAKRHNDTLSFDVDFYKKQPTHVGKRGIIGTEDFPNIKNLNFVNRTFIESIIENKYLSHIIRYNTGLNLLLGKTKIVVEKLHRHYVDVPYKNGINNYYDGYWQSDAYFSDYEDEIRKIFMPPADIFNKVKNWRANIDSKCCVAVHIRRGDYLNKINQGKINTTDDNNFYLSAFEMANTLLENPVFCFFSDDIAWCKQTYEAVLPNAVFVENKCKDGALLDLFSIAQCDHGIMSPSTFSYWGNWLRDPIKNGIVIYPEGDYSEAFITNNKWIEIKR
jgi:hypothetical protein